MRSKKIDQLVRSLIENGSQSEKENLIALIAAGIETSNPPSLMHNLFRNDLAENIKTLVEKHEQLINEKEKQQNKQKEEIIIKSGFFKLKSKDGGKIDYGCGKFLGENNITYFFLADDEVLVSTDINIHQLAKVCNDYNLSYKNNVIEPWIKVMLWGKG